MATTSNTYTGNGSNKLFSITFPYLDTSDIDVYLNGTLQTITTHYTFANATTVEFVAAPANGAVILLDRSTDDSDNPATFFPGSSIKASDLNENFDQTLYVVQELGNQLSNKVNKSGDTMSGILDMGGNLITTLGYPLSDGHAANKLYVDSAVGGVPGIPGHTRWTITATASQTLLSGTGLEGNTLEYSPSREEVYVNGALLLRNYDYTANDGITITMLSPLLLGDSVDIRCVNNLAFGITGLAADVTFVPDGTGAISRNVNSKLKDTISVKDFGAVGDGVTDDTVAIQAAIDNAANMFNQVAYPPAGGVYTSPILFFPPGAYRLTDTLNVYPGLTLSGQAGIPYTVEHTRLIMDTQGGTVNLTKNILNLTMVFQGVARSNSVTVTIEDLGFWITNPGSTIIARGGTGSIYNPTTGGSHIYCAEQSIDTRIRRCNFYSSPNAAIYFNGVPNSSINVDECEFDTPSVGIRLNNCPNAWPQVNNSRFFSGVYQFLSVDTGGKVQINGCDFQVNARISASGTRQLESFTFTANNHVGSGGSDNALYVQNAQLVNITGNYVGLSTDSAIYLVDVDGGTINGNTIYSPGYNTSNSSASTAPAGIRLIGCQQLAVSGNAISTATGATYNGFGIISTNNGGRTSRCAFTGNKISDVFTGAIHRSQSRILNVETTDSLVGNQYDGTTVEHRMLRTSAGVNYAIPLTYQGSPGSVLIPLIDTASSRAYVHVEQLSSNASFEFEVVITRTQFSSTYSIKGVNRDVTAGVGNGPHVLTPGNTVAFAISGSNLQVTFAYTTDPMLYSAVVIGARA